MVSPTDALMAKGTYRKTPCVGATMTVCVQPELLVAVVVVEGADHVEDAIVGAP